MTDQTTPAQKTALVTGANKGIGLEIARRLLAENHLVWIGCRDAARGAAALAALGGEAAGARLLAIDVADDASVAAAAAALAGQTDRLDVLVNNAGIATNRDLPSEEPVDTVKAIYEVNVFGPIRVTQALLPLLRRSPAPRIVMLSSGLGSLAALSDPANPFYAVNLLGYNSSKTALNAITLSLAKELAAAGFKVNAADPGYTATDLNDNSGYRTVEQGAEAAVRLALLGEDGPTGGYFDEDGPIAW